MANLDQYNGKFVKRPLQPGWLFLAAVLIIGSFVVLVWIGRNLLPKDSPSVEAATAVVDQSCTFMGDETSYHTVRNNSSLGQTITVGNLGQITSVKLRMGAFPNIFDGTVGVSLTRLSDSQTYSSQVLDFAGSPMVYPDETWYTFQFNNPVNVTAGEKLRINVINSSADWQTDVFWISSTLGWCYSPGSFTDGGIENDFFDLLFQVYGYPPEVVSDGPVAESGATTPTDSSQSPTGTGSSRKSTTKNNQNPTLSNQTTAVDATAPITKDDKTITSAANFIPEPWYREVWIWILSGLAIALFIFLVIKRRKAKKNGR